MNRELDTFLYEARHLLADQHTELASLRGWTDEQILAFGSEAYNTSLNAKLDFIGVFSDFVVKCAILLNEGKSLGEVLAQMMRSRDNSNPTEIALMQACCVAILEAYLYIDFNKLLNKG